MRTGRTSSLVDDIVIRPLTPNERAYSPGFGMQGGEDSWFESARLRGSTVQGGVIGEAGSEEADWIPGQRPGGWSRVPEPTMKPVAEGVTPTAPAARVPLRIPLHDVRLKRELAHRRLAV